MARMNRHFVDVATHHHEQATGEGEDRICKECGQTFFAEASSDRWFREKGLTPSVRCERCRLAKKARFAAMDGDPQPQPRPQHLEGEVGWHRVGDSCPQPREGEVILGKLVVIDVEKKFGFIVPLGGRSRVDKYFFHKGAYEGDDFNRLLVHAHLEFVAMPTDQSGRLRAEKVRRPF